jgi:hypothetical protein
MVLHRCMHCLAANSCEVRFDKKGRPFTSCRVCSTRAFFHSMDALRRVAIAPELLEAALARRARDPEYAKVIDGKIATLAAHVRSAVTAPSPAPALRGLPAEQLPVVPFDEAKSA